MKEVYISFDVESSGPSPPRNYMLSLGAVAFSSTGQQLDTFYANFAPLLDSCTDPDTKRFWDANPEAYAATQTDLELPDAAMHRFYWWCKGVQQSQAKELLNGLENDQDNHHGLPMLVPTAFGLAYDGLFLFYYLFSFGERQSPFVMSSHATGLDLKSAAWGVRPRTSFRQQTKRRLPKNWMKGLPPHSHNALDDAIEQGHLLFRMMLERDGELG